MLSTSRPVMTASGSTLQKRAIFFFSSGVRSRSQRATMISGCIPSSSMAFTECWVGFVFSSPAAGM